MRLTNILFHTPKTKTVMVVLRSTGSSHQIRSFRLKNDDKKEIIYFDPFIEMECVYKEEKKIRSMKHPMTITKNRNEDSYGIIPKELLQYDVPPTKQTSQKRKNKTDEPQKTS